LAIQIDLTSDDLTQIRFSYSPIIELMSSYRVLVVPKYQGPYRRWVEEARRNLYGIDIPYADAMLNILQTCGYVPDFMTPTPTTVITDIECEIQRVLATPDDLVRKNVQQLIAVDGDSEMRQFFIAYPRDALNCLAEDLRLYWSRALERHWPHMSSVLEGDVIYRGRQMAVQGVIELFSLLNPNLFYRPGQIELRKTEKEADVKPSLEGQGLQLVPSVFASESVYWQIVPEYAPMLIYGARGAGIWQTEAPDRNESLEVALGVGRARVLQGLMMPSSTSELAVRLEITAGAASQHLARLQEAGLVESHRMSHRVYYQLTQKGEDLLALFGAA
jgi:DNA-binding transcriptional ArsR family regulator